MVMVLTLLMMAIVLWMALVLALLWCIFAALTDTRTIAGSLTKAKQLIHSKVSFISPTKLKDMLDVEKHLTS